MKKPTLYYFILSSWIILLILFYPQFVDPINRTFGSLRVFVVVSTLFVLYFWLNGLKDVIYTLYYHIFKPKLKLPPIVYDISDEPFVELIYLTCNDFDPNSLLKSMNQQYRNFRVVICDDSTKSEYKRAIDEFQSTYNITVIRRSDNKGFKAGNVNNYLQHSTAKYYVILDSDEVIPPNFIRACLQYFYNYNNVGIVQANHVVTKMANRFVQTFSLGVESHWSTYQSIKNTYGFLSFLGHGAMISAECYSRVGGFPEVVAEDLCFSISARELGYYTYFAHDIVCEEEYPISYLAFKRRHNKWTQGNMEFIKKYTLVILFSKMSWFEKLDIFLFTYNLPLSIVFVFYIIINIIVFPVYDFTLNYPVALAVPTVLFLLAPMLNDILYYGKKINHHKILIYCVFVLSLYGSMLFISLRASLLSMFGKSVFLVTPKTTEKLSIRQAVVANFGEITFGVVVSVVCISFNQSLFPVILIVIPALQSVALTLMSNE